MLSPSSNNEGNGAWLMKMELKREEPGEVNKDNRIKKVTEYQAPVAEEEAILPPLFTPTEIEAFKMIELAHIQNKYLTHENILCSCFKLFSVKVVKARAPLLQQW